MDWSPGQPWLLPWNMGFPAEFPSSKCWEGFEQKVLSNINKMDHDGSTQYTEIQRLKRPQTVLGSAKIPSQLPWLLSLPPWCENDPPLPALLSHPIRVTPWWTSLPWDLGAIRYKYPLVIVQHSNGKWPLCRSFRSYFNGIFPSPRCLSLLGFFRRTRRRPRGLATGLGHL